MKFILTILALIVGGLCALAFILTPAGKATVLYLTASLHAPTAVVASTALPKLNDDELAAPPLDGETALAVPKEEPAPAAADEDTFGPVMAIYEQDGKDQAAESAAN